MYAKGAARTDVDTVTADAAPLVRAPPSAGFIVLGALLLTAGFVAAPRGGVVPPAVGHVSLVVLPLATGIACFVAGLGSTRRIRIVWSLLGAASLATATARLLGVAPFTAAAVPPLPLLLAVAFYPAVLAAGLILLHPLELDGESGVATLDSGLVLMATLVLVLRFVGEPFLAGAGAAPLPTAPMLVHGGATAALAVAALLLFWRRTPLPAGSVAGLVLGTGLFSIASLLTDAGFDPDPGSPGDPFDALWILGWLGLLWGGLAGALQRSGNGEEFSRRVVGLLRQTVVPGTVLALGVVSVHAAARPRVAFPTAVAAGLLCGLLVVRIILALRTAERGSSDSRALAHSRALVEVSRALAGSMELGPTLQLVSRWTAHLLGARSTGIELLDSSGDTLHLRATWGEFGGRIGMQFPVRGSFTGWVVTHGRVRSTANALSDPIITPAGASSVGGGPLAAAPLQCRGRTLGTLFACGHERPFEPEELDLLRAMADQAAVAIETARLFEEVRALSMTDPLTGLANRRQLDRDLAREFAAARRGRKLVAVMFDVDGFKQYNDRHGHLAGDDVLRSLGRVLLLETRTMNLAARFGGDEFVVVLTDTDWHGAQAFAQRVREEFSAEAAAKGHPGVRASAGIAEFHPGMRSPEELLRAADHALYAAKELRSA